MRKFDQKKPDIKTGKIQQACVRYGLGATTMRKLAEEAGAVVRIGKCYLVNFSKVDEYMDRMSE
ncbi:DUF6462 family protein [Oliverpabstia intestinalis]|uniref:DUF6462 family protein n=1 Tax=Oliverpabstia intestinalis TaxID=2606633 RepID=UPI0024099BC1|nr:DUF6462 family protein [Oliverpabstia intestinalis]MDD6411748.1 DUF6462 family protein [Oliverpabstia intestinalis]